MTIKLWFPCSPCCLGQTGEAALEGGDVGFEEKGRQPSVSELSQSCTGNEKSNKGPLCILYYRHPSIARAEKLRTLYCTLKTESDLGKTHTIPPHRTIRSLI